MGDPMVPALRFKDENGQDFSLGYQTKKLAELATFSKGKGISKKDVDTNGKNECIRYGELYTSYGVLIDQINTRTNLALDELVISKANDIIIPASGETAIDLANASCIKKSGIAIGGDINIIRSDHNAVYLAYYLNGKKKTSIARYAQGSSVIHLYSAQLKLLKLTLPYLPEQQKIADFLSSVDKKIEQLTRKKELLEKYKTGMMQKLFPKAGEQHPELRFKDENGQDFPDWDIKSLDNICVISKGEQLNKNELFESGLYPSISGGINPSGYTDKWNTDAGTIIISEGGNSCGYVNFIDTKFWCGGHCYKIQNIEDLHIYFLYQCLKFYERNIMRLRVGSGLPNIQKKDISRFLIIYPSLPEQQKIADFLSAIDEKITMVEGKLTKAQTFKKGLLQQMFV